MHRCWAVAELVDLIFCQLDSDLDRDVALCRLAITCRAFLDPALNPLWRTQHSLVPLLKCLPKIWRVAQHPQDDFSCAAALTPADWDRLLSYSSRIKMLVLYTSRPPLSIATMEFLNLSLPVDCLLPNWVNIAWSPQDHALLPYTRLLLGPKLNEAYLSLTSPPSRLAILPWLASRYPAITSLQVFIEPSSDAGRGERVQAVSSMASALTAVQTMSVCGLDFAAFKHLASIRTLKVLVLEMVDEPLSSGNVLSDSAFPSLEILSIESSSSLDLCTNAIRGLSNSPLDTFSAAVGQHATERQSSVFFSALHAHLQHTTLTSIELDLGPMPDDAETNPDLYTIRPSTLRPLLSFRNLVSVELHRPYRIRLDDDFVAEMVLAWPRIALLCFSTRYLVGVRSPAPSVTLTGLAALARHCPECRCCGFLSTQRRTPRSRSPFPTCTQTSLKILHIIDSSIDSAFVVSAFLSSVFPSLAEINTSRLSGLMDYEHGPDPADPMVHATWREVEKLVPMFAKIRAEEGVRWRGWLGTEVSLTDVAA